MAGSSRRSSARFSIISDPQDLDMLSSLGPPPDIDDFFYQSYPSPLDNGLDVVSSPPPNVPLPSPTKSPSRILDLATKPFVNVTPSIASRTRALSPIHGEDETTPVQRPLAVFSEQESSTTTATTTMTATDTNMLTPGPTSDETPLARQGRSPIGMTPLMAFPIPPPRAMSFEGLHSTLLDEIDKLVASEVEVSEIFSVGLGAGAGAGTLQPAPDLSANSATSPISEQEASVPDAESVDSVVGASETPTTTPTPVDAEVATTNDQELVSVVEEEAVPVSSESEDYEPHEAITDTDHTDTETDAEADKDLSPDPSLPSSPGVHELMNRFRGFQLRNNTESHEDGDGDGDEAEAEDDEPDYEIPLYEAAVRAGILSSRSKLLWPAKPKRRTFIPPRFRLAEPAGQVESTGWSGSESEEEEFNEVLARIGRKKLAQKTAAKYTITASGTQQSLTPPKDHRASLRLSMISESSTSSSTSASSIGILTPDPHRTKFAMGPYDPLNHTPTHTHTNGHPGRLSIITRSWSASKASTGSALGIPLPTSTATAIPIRRTKSFTRILPAPKRQVKGWGKPEILLEDDEAPLINSSSEDEDPSQSQSQVSRSVSTKRHTSPMAISRTGKASGNRNRSGDSSLGLTTMARHHGAEDEGENGDDWIMNETEPEFIAGEFSLSVPPTRYLGIPF